MGQVNALDRGVVGVATSPDLVTWSIAEPLSGPGAGFRHLEVLQLLDFDGERVLLFSCDTPALAGDRERRGETGGVWAVAAPTATGPGSGPIDIAAAHLVHDESLYAARAVRDRDGQWQLFGFRNHDDAGEFVGEIAGPLPLRWSPAEQRLIVAAEVTA